MTIKNRTIFTGDNLHVLRGMESELVDLIYLDPPFNNNANYAVPIGSAGGGGVQGLVDSGRHGRRVAWRVGGRAARAKGDGQFVTALRRYGQALISRC